MVFFFNLFSYIPISAGHYSNNKLIEHLFKFLELTRRTLYKLLVAATYIHEGTYLPWTHTHAATLLL